ncbi:Hypothetical predicted protein [Octopus vulgaris]|uniref:Uncharacterized protein n=1 Tax=Octopus vulgaris TaxID=6645 RepID=A0AA36B4R4_OCTVU|nr:Hypothetical predicted protein [Octopus vulgaris]
MRESRTRTEFAQDSICEERCDAKDKETLAGRRQKMGDVRGQAITSLCQHSGPSWFCLDEGRRRVVLGELTVPSEERIAEADERKLLGYEELVAEIREKGYICELVVFEVGCRGFPAAFLRRFLKVAGVSGARKIIKECEEKTIKGSAWITWRKSKDKEIIESFSKLKIEENDRTFYNYNLLFSYILPYVTILLPVLCHLLINLVLPISANKFRTALRFDVTISNPYRLPLAIVQVLLHGISLAFLIFDWYMNMTIEMALLHEFNKLARSCEKYFITKSMELKETRFYKILQFYGKINICKISLMNISLKSLKCKNICISAFYIFDVAAAYYTQYHSIRSPVFHVQRSEFLNKLFKCKKNS